MRRTSLDKGFDCVEMKRKGATRIYEALKGLTSEEKHAYWQRVNEEFLRRRENRCGKDRSPTRSIPNA